jgi:hypothetical protein
MQSACSQSAASNLSLKLQTRHPRRFIQLCLTQAWKPPKLSPATDRSLFSVQCKERYVTSFSGEFSSQLIIFHRTLEEKFGPTHRNAFVGLNRLLLYCAKSPKTRHVLIAKQIQGFTTLTREDSHSTTSYSLEDPCLTCFMVDSTSRRTGRANDCGPSLTHHPHSLRNGCFAVIDVCLGS